MPMATCSINSHRTHNWACHIYIPGDIATCTAPTIHLPLLPQAIEALSTALTSRPSLTSLSLKACWLESADLAVLASHLGPSTSLRNLDLQANMDLGTEAWDVLAGAMAVNKSLRVRLLVNDELRVSQTT